METEKMKKKHNIWFGFSMMLVGVVVGFMVAPIKKGVNVKNICGNHYWKNDSDEEQKDDYDEDEVLKF